MKKPPRQSIGCKECETQHNALCFHTLPRIKQNPLLSAATYLCMKVGTEPWMKKLKGTGLELRVVREPLSLILGS